jgi:exodeoxyribonuclease VII large subunit
VSQPSFDFELEDDGGQPTFTVGELADLINGSLRRSFGDGLWIRGEIQGYGERNGHAYFRLVENGENGKAVIDCSLFANTRMKLRPLLQRNRLRLGDGMKVRIFGYLDFYAPNGRLSLKMSGIDPRYTLGEMAIERDDIVRRLVASGLYDANRTRTLNGPPFRVGVITSVGSAAWHDFTHELEQSGHGFSLRVIDVRVQGEFAAAMVSNAISALAKQPDLDLIVLVRGGGSRTELAVFDAEAIARAIAASPIPVFTGLGHEIDRSVADEVAHTAFKTPTACAGALIERVNSFSQRTDLIWQAISQRVDRIASAATTNLAELARKIEQRTIGAVERADQRLLDRSHRTASAAVRMLDRSDSFYAAATQRLQTRPSQHVSRLTLTLDQIEARVRSLDPVHTLARGWSLTRTADGVLVRDPSTLAIGDEIVTSFASGETSSRVVQTRGNQT